MIRNQSPPPVAVDVSTNGASSVLWSISHEQLPLLRQHRIARIGIEDTAAPYCRVRHKPPGSFLLICTEGRGRMLLDGRWISVRENTACMAPPRVLNSFHTPPGSRWHFHWIRYDEPPGTAPVVGATSPVRLRYDAQRLAAIFEGLRAEWEGPQDPSLLRHWVELLQAHARRLAKPWQINERVAGFWTHVSDRVSEPWTLDSLARSAHMSAEHLRRLCLRELGRSPMAHLTSLRMQRAQELLEACDDKLEAISTQVGYESALAFSRAFRRWVGMSPSEYRARKS